ncbi:hypothetical protein HDU96_002236, partial [Phlyctochytrium bullatum]
MFGPRRGGGAGGGTNGPDPAAGAGVAAAAVAVATPGHASRKKDRSKEGREEEMDN